MPIWWKLGFLFSLQPGQSHSGASPAEPDWVKQSHTHTQASAHAHTQKSMKTANHLTKQNMHLHLESFLLPWF